MTDKLAGEKELLGKITPGPWKYLLTKSRTRCDGIVAESAWNAEDKYWEDYIVQTDGGFYGPNVSDAQLIAMSPDLLRDNIALREALAKYGQHAFGCNSHHCWHTVHEPTCCDCGLWAILPEALSSSEVREGK